LSLEGGASLPASLFLLGTARALLQQLTLRGGQGGGASASEQRAPSAADAFPAEDRENESDDQRVAGTARDHTAALHPAASMHDASSTRHATDGRPLRSADAAESGNPSGESGLSATYPACQMGMCRIRERPTMVSTAAKGRMIVPVPMAAR